ncbi:MAG: LamG-like jellyroll fold domain-containing protein, partial [bacterium]
FTLIELLVVISIIGLLASIVLVGLEGGEESAITSKAMSFSHTVRVSLGADLVGEWKFDDQSNPTKDSSGNNNHGTLVNSPQWVDGIFGKALSFNGTSSYVDCGSSDALNINSQFTFEAWIYPLEMTGGGDMVTQRIGYNALGLIYNVSSGQITFGGSYYPGANNYFFSTKKHEFNKWYHLVLTQDTVNGMILYVNAGEDYKRSSFNGVNTLFDNTKIGMSELGPNYFKGNIDETRIYSRALSLTEIQQLYAEGAARHNFALK